MREMLAKVQLTGLRARLLGIVLLAVVPLALLLFAYANLTNQQALDRAREEVRGGLSRDVQSLQDLFGEGQATLETFGITYAIQARDWTLAQGNSDRLRLAHPGYSAIAVADPKGIVRAVSPRRSEPIDLSGDTLFKRAVATRGLVVSDYAVGPITGQTLIRIGLPVYGPHDELVAVEMLSLASDEFRKRLAARGSVSIETLIDERGTVIASQPQGASAEGKLLPDAEMRRYILSARRGETSTPIGGGASRLTYFSPLFDPGQGSLYLMVSFSTDVLFAEQRRVFAMTLLGFGGVALLALLGAWLVGTYSIYRPTALLGQAAARLSAGDLTARAELGRPSDEFEQLEAEFNSMAQAIQAQVVELEQTQRELADLNADLEDRVRRRTSELEASVQELETFSYSVSHDLRSPLRAIDGFSLALLEDYWDKLDDEGRDDLRRVRDNATKMGQLIDSLLALSRLSRQEMVIQDVDLSAIVTESAAALKELEPDREVAVEVQPDVRANGDPTLLRNVFDNLLGNAWKFTSRHESASIRFGTQVIDGETAYFVSDDGAGFDMAYATKLFGAFQRLHGQTEFPGIGIGLATTARIIHRHGGRIWAEGEPEKGATFWFTLP